MPLQLYLDLMSQPCRAIAMLCHFNNIDFEQKTVLFSTGETRGDAFGKVTPFKKVPVLQDDDFILTESVAILRYLMNKYNCAEHWYPSNIRQRARVDEFLMWLFCEGGLRFKAAWVFIQQALIPFRSNTPTDKEAVEQKIKELQPLLDMVESYFLKGGEYKFIGGCDDVTLADMVALCELMQPISVGYDVANGRPALAAWIERTKSRLQPHFDDAHKAVTEFSSKYQM